jgi:hypothetical protein
MQNSIAQRYPTEGSDMINGVPTIKGVEWIFYNVLANILAFLGIVFFLMVLLGGFKFITAGGNPQSAEAAKKTLTTAVAGVVLAAMALLIIRFISAFTGVELAVFRIVN